VNLNPMGAPLPVFQPELELNLFPPGFGLFPGRQGGTEPRLFRLEPVPVQADLLCARQQLSDILLPHPLFARKLGEQAFDVDLLLHPVKKCNLVPFRLGQRDRVNGSVEELQCGRLASG